MKLKIAPFFGANQFTSSRFFNVAARIRWQSKNQERPLGFSRSISFFAQPQRCYLPLLVCLLAATIKAGKWRKDVLEDHAPFCFNFFFLQKIFARLKSLFFTRICICNRVRIVVVVVVVFFFLRRWVTWLIPTFRDRTWLVLLLFPWLRGEVSGKRSKQLAKKCELESWQSSLCAFSLSFVLSFLSLFLPTFSIFFSFTLTFIKLVKPVRHHTKYILMTWLVLDQTHTLSHTREVRRDAEMPKGDSEQFSVSLDLWITD